MDGWMDGWMDGRDGRDAVGGWMGGWMGGSVGCTDTWDGGMDGMAHTHTHTHHTATYPTTHTHPSTPTYPHPHAHPTHPHHPRACAHPHPHARAPPPAVRPTRAHARGRAHEGTDGRTHARTHGRKRACTHERARHQEWLGEEWPELRPMQGMQAMLETQGLLKALAMLALQCFEPSLNSSSSGRAAPKALGMQTMRGVGGSDRLSEGKALHGEGACFAQEAGLTADRIPKADHLVFLSP